MGAESLDRTLSSERPMATQEEAVLAAKQKAMKWIDWNLAKRRKCHGVPSTGPRYISVNRIVRIEADERQYTVVWINELNMPETMHVKKENSEAVEYLLSK